MFVRQKWLHCMCSSHICHKMYILQAFIHPGLAYFFWSTHKVTDLSSLFSPYQSCNGTFTFTINHEMTYTYGEVPFAFYDLAGCGLVHVCGEQSSNKDIYSSLCPLQEVLQHLFLVYSTSWRHPREPRSFKIYHY